MDEQAFIELALNTQPEDVLKQARQMDPAEAKAYMDTMYAIKNRAMVQANEFNQTAKTAPKVYHALNNPVMLAAMSNNKQAVQAFIDTEHSYGLWEKIKYAEPVKAAFNGLKGVVRNTLNSVSMWQENAWMPDKEVVEHRKWKEQGGLSNLDLQTKVLSSEAKHSFTEVGGAANVAEFRDALSLYFKALFATPKAMEIVKTMAQSEILKREATQANSLPGRIGLATVENAPQFAAQLALNSRFGAGVSMGFMGGQIAGAQYEELRAKGVAPDRAKTASISNAALQAPFEQLSLNFMFRPLRVTGKLAKGKEILKSSVTEGFTEFLQEYPESATSIWAEYEGKSPDEMWQKFKEDFGETSKQGLFSGAVGFLYGGLGGTAHVAMQKKMNDEFVNTIGRANNKLATAQLQGNEGVTRAVMEHITDKSVYIDPDALILQQQANPKTFEVLELDEETVSKAAQTGELVEVGLPLFQVATSNDPQLLESLKEDITHDKDEYTNRQLSLKNKTDIAKAIKENIQEQQDLKSAVLDMKEQFRKDGGMTKEQADSAAVILVHHAGVYAPLKGLTVAEYIRQEAPRFYGREYAGVGEGAFNQAAMRLSPFTNVVDYKNYVTQSGIKPHEKGKEYFQFYGQSGVVFDVAFDDMKHFSGKHNLTNEQLEVFVEYVESLEFAYLDNKKKGDYGGSPVLVKINTPIGKAGSVFEVLPNGRIFVKTAFFDTDANIDNWAQKEGASTSLLDKSNPSSFTDHPSLIEIIKQALGIVNNKYDQRAGPTQTAEQKLAADEAAFAQVVDDFKPDQTLTGMVQVMTTPLVMKLVGADLHPIKIAPSILHKTLFGKHAGKFTKEMVKSLPRALTDPLVILKNKDKDGTVIPGEVMMVVELKDSKDAVQVPIILDANHHMHISNDIKSVFVRNKAAYYGYAMLLSDILYVDTKRGRKLLNDIGQSTPHRIVITSSFANSIPNEHDLVKLKEQYSGMYQSDSAPKGNITWDAQGRAIISLFERGDASTVIHEMVGHFFFQELLDLGAQENAPDWLKADRQALLDFCDLESWESASIDQRKTAHEKVAAAAEAYIMEGKFPAVELRNVFARFKKWLTNVYKIVSNITYRDAQGIDHPIVLTDGVREVFGRMLASEQQIAETAALQEWHKKLPENMLAGLDPARVSELDKFILQAREKAESNLRKILVSFISQKNKDLIAKERLVVMDEVIDGLSKQAEYAAVNEVKGEFRKHYKDSWAIARKYINNKLPVDQAVHFELIAEKHGFSSGSELATKIDKLPRLEKQAKKLTEEIIKQRYKDVYGNNELMEQEADANMYNDEGAMVNAIEWELIEEKLTNVRDEQLRHVRIEHARLKAKYDIEKLTLNEALKVRSYISAERKAYGKFTQAVQKGNYQDALEYKIQQMYNHAMVTESLRVRREHESVTRYLKRQQRVKKQSWVNQDYLDQAAEILGRFGFAREGWLPGKKEKSLMEWAGLIKQSQDYEVQLAPWLYNESLFMPQHKGLTLDEFKDVADAVRHIKFLANRENKLTRIGRKQNIEDAAVQAADELQHLCEVKGVNDLEPDRGLMTFLRGKLRSTAYSVMHATQFITRMDNNRDNGFFSELFLRPITEGADIISNLVNEFTAKEKAAREKYQISDKAMESRKYYDELGATVSRSFLIEMASHLGTEGNRRVLFGKRPVMNELESANQKLWVQENPEQTGQNIMDFLSRELTADEWSYVQAGWDNVGFLFPLTQKVHRETTGFALEGVERLTFVVTTADGTRVAMAGGYYPLKTDSRANAQAEKRAAEAKPTYMEMKAMIKPTTYKGHTKERTGAIYELDLNVNNRYRHIAQVTHDIAMREVIMDLNRLMSNNMFRNALRQYMGDEGIQYLKEYVAMVSLTETKDSKIGSEGFDSASNFLRRNVTAAVLMGNMKTVIQNYANVVLYANTVEGFGHTDMVQGLYIHGANGYWAQLLSGQKHNMYHDVVEKSAFMRDRTEAPDFTLRELKFENNENFWIKWGGKMLAATDNHTAVPMWWTAYLKKINAGATEAQAVAYADLLIRRVIGSGRKMDTAPIMREHKLLTMFGSFMNAQLNEFIRVSGISWRDKNPVPILTHVATRMVLFSFVNNLLFKGIGGLFGDDEEQKDWLKEWAKEYLGYTAGHLPIIGSVLAQAIPELMGERSYGYRPSPIIDVGVKASIAGKTTVKYLEGEVEGERALEALMTSGAYLVPYPHQFNKWFWNAYDVMENDMEFKYEDIYRRRPRRER